MKKEEKALYNNGLFWEKKQTLSKQNYNAVMQQQ